MSTTGPSLAAGASASAPAAWPAPALVAQARSAASPAAESPSSVRKRGRFRAFVGEKADRTSEAAEGAPAVKSDPAGLPYVLACPTCQKAFAVSPKDREGNCPHCNAPLAFLSEKEYNALKEAEERKQAFQSKMQRRRAERLEREQRRAEERLHRKTAGGPGPVRLLLKGLRFRAPPTGKVSGPSTATEARPGPAKVSPSVPKGARGPPPALEPGEPPSTAPKATGGTRARRLRDRASIEASREDTPIIEFGPHPAAGDPSPPTSPSRFAWFRRWSRAGRDARESPGGNVVDVAAGTVPASEPPAPKSPPTPSPRVRRGPAKAEPSRGAAPAGLEIAGVEISAEPTPTAPGATAHSRASKELRSRFPWLRRRPVASNRAGAVPGPKISERPVPGGNEPPSPRTASKRSKAGKASGSAPSEASTAVEFASVDLDAPPAAEPPAPPRGLLARLRRPKPSPSTREASEEAPAAEAGPGKKKRRDKEATEAASVEAVIEFGD